MDNSFVPTGKEKRENANDPQDKREYVKNLLCSHSCCLFIPTF
jgi:hypothetical protein